MRKYLTETAENPDSARRDAKTNTFSQKEFSKRGSADLPQRITNARYGDNPLLEFDRASTLDKLHDMLNRAGVDDEEIRYGVQLTNRGMQKVAGSLGVSAKEVPALLNSLSGHISDDDHNGQQSLMDNEYQRMVAEASEQLSFEKDYLGNVTVRDAHSGKEAYIQGGEASDLLVKLKRQPHQQQEILAGYQNLMEADGFQDEIDADTGTYNMTWKIGEQQGTATVLYHLIGDKPRLTIQSIRDEDGNEIKADHRMLTELQRQAKNFIGQE